MWRDEANSTEPLRGTSDSSRNASAQTCRRDLQKNFAEQAVRPLWGVRGITNSIDIVPVAQPGDIKSKIHSSFKRHADLDADKVHVEVKDKAVTLSGEVSSWSERDNAEIAAWSAPGISRVQNMLSVRL